jgi:predicted alpha-1,2-mannosidase
MYVIARKALYLVFAACLAGCGGSSGNPSSKASSPGAVAPGSTPVAPGSSPAVPAPGAVAPASGGPAASTPIQNADLQLTQYVNPFVGTEYNASGPQTEAGGTFPGVTLPFGMIQWTPVTPSGISQSINPGYTGGYDYNDNVINSFSVLHLSGTGCYGNASYLNVMPTFGGTPQAQGSVTGTFSHQNEIAQPGYYSVTLNNGIKVELTATTRTGFGRFTYPTLTGSQIATVTFDPTWIDARGAGYLSSDTMAVYNSTTYNNPNFASNNTVTGTINGSGFCWAGHSIPLYFVATFDHTFANTPSLPSNSPVALTFNVSASSPVVQMKLGISFVSVENAIANLQAENPNATSTGQSNWNFSAVQQAAIQVWNTRLNAIQVSDGTASDMTKFYTALYHASLHPNVFNDVNGQYPAFYSSASASSTPVEVVAPGRNMYANFSGWDIDRSFIQLQAMLDPVRTGDMIQSLVLDAGACGTAFPRWAYFNTETGVMPGDAGTLITANAYAFGVRNFDTQTALSIIQSSTLPGASCGGATTMVGRSDFNTLGYVPADDFNQGSNTDGQSASDTLEYSIRDFAASQFASAMNDSADASALLNSSGNWKNIFQNGLPGPRASNGTWTGTGGFMEAVAGQYVWYVLQNLAGLINTIGGNTAAVQQLDTFFQQLNAGWNGPYFDAGNEPTFAVPWIYDWAGAPSHAQTALHQILTTVYTDQPDGLPGNDDLGAMSGWYVWASLGLYPEIPGVGGLAISAPQFDNIAVRVGQHDGTYRLLTITAPGTGSGSSSSYYVDGLQVNGSNYPSAWLPYSTVSGGGTLAFSMTGQASATNWGTNPSAMPSFPAPASEAH